MSDAAWKLTDLLGFFAGVVGMAASSQAQTSEERIDELLHELVDRDRRLTAALQRISDIERRESAFLNGLPGVAWMTDAEGRYLHVWEGFEAAFGIPPCDVVGRTFEQVWPNDVAALLRRHVHRVVETGERLTIVEELPTPSGERHNWVVNKFRIDEATGPVVGCVAFDTTQAGVALQDWHAQVKRVQSMRGHHA